MSYFFDQSPYSLQDASQPWSYQDTQVGSDEILRFEVRPGDHWRAADGTKERSEISSGEKLEFGQTYTITYGFMVEPGAKSTEDNVKIGQLHGTPDADDSDNLGPVFAIQLDGEKMKVVVRSDADAITADRTTDNFVYGDASDITRGHWYDMKITFELDPQGHGMLQVWRDGVELVNYSGALGYNDAVGPYWKEGIYRAAGDVDMAVDYKDTMLVTGDGQTTTGPVLSEAPPPSAGPVGQTIVSSGVYDTLTGGDGADTIHGGQGGDVIVANLGDDSIIGGAGATETIDAGGGNDVITLAATRAGASAYALGGGGDDTIVAGGGHETILAGDGQDKMTAPTGSASDDLFMFGNQGDDVITSASVGGASLFGGQGEDVLTVTAAPDTHTTGVHWVFGNLGDDTISLTGAGTVWGGQGDDHIVGLGSEPQQLGGDLGDDTIIAGPGGDTLIGGVGADSIVASNSGGDVIVLHAGDSTAAAADSEANLDHVLNFDVSHDVLAFGGHSRGDGGQVGNLIIFNDSTSGANRSEASAYTAAYLYAYGDGTASHLPHMSAEYLAVHENFQGGAGGGTYVFTSDHQAVALDGLAANLLTTDDIVAGA